jgi:hypothetical protein
VPRSYFCGCSGDAVGRHLTQTFNLPSVRIACPRSIARATFAKAKRECRETSPPKFSASGGGRCRTTGRVAFHLGASLSDAAGASDRASPNTAHRRRTMKGVVFLGDRKLELREFPDPTPGSRDVILDCSERGPLRHLVVHRACPTGDCTSPSASAAACRGTRHRPGRRQASGEVPSGRYSLRTLLFRCGHTNHHRSPPNGGRDVARKILSSIASGSPVQYSVVSYFKRTQSFQGPPIWVSHSTSRSR